MSNNYKIIRTIFENEFQRVLECKFNDNSDVFYNNVITSQKVINMINIDELKNLSSNIIECYKTDDRMYIITKTLKTNYKDIKEFATSKKLTLKHQFALSKKIIELSCEIFDMTDVVQQKILDLNRIYIDNEENIIVDCNLIFQQEYDIPENETLKRIGNIIHFIFSGSEIVDYNISEVIPPDILKIIVRCLTREYKHPKDALDDMIQSPIYNMIFLNNAKTTDKPLKKIESVNISKQYTINEDNEGESEDKIENNEENVLNIYLNRNDFDENEQPIRSSKFFNNLKYYKKALISFVIIIIVLLIGSKAINKINDSKKVSSDKTEENENKNQTDNNVENEKIPGNTNEAQSNNIENDSTFKYFNDELIKNIGYEGPVAQIDKDIFVEGQNSLVISNETDEKIKALFAAVNFKDESNSYLLKKQIGISAKAKSENDVSVQIVLEAYKDGKLASNFHTKTDIYDDMWTQITIPINVTNADSLQIYMEYSNKNKVWIDSIQIDVFK